MWLFPVPGLIKWEKGVEFWQTCHLLFLAVRKWMSMSSTARKQLAWMNPLSLQVAEVQITLRGVSIQNTSCSNNTNLDRSNQASFEDWLARAGDGHIIHLVMKFLVKNWHSQNLQSFENLSNLNGHTALDAFYFLPSRHYICPLIARPGNKCKSEFLKQR